MPRTSARKYACHRKVPAVSEIASQIGGGLLALAEAVETHACIMAYLAAAEHTRTAGEQRQLAAVMFQTARKRFGGVKYDGLRIEDLDLEGLDAILCRFHLIDPKKLPKR